MKLFEFVNVTSSEVLLQAEVLFLYCGSMGAALGTMVANLSAHKEVGMINGKIFELGGKRNYFSNELLRLVDEDTNAFNKIVEAFRLPKDSEKEKEFRNITIQLATKFAIAIPYKVMQTAYESMEVMRQWLILVTPTQ